MLGHSMLDSRPTASTLVARTRDHVRRVLEGEGTGHDWWHVHRVWQSAVAIAQQEGADLLIVELAALLHDIADWKFHHGDPDAGPRAARHWLTGQQAEPAVIDAVCEIVGGLSFKGAAVPTPMPTLEGRVVQDADRLDALGAVGIARAFAYGGYRQLPLHDPAVTPQPHATFAAYRDHQGTTINHFYEKLLLLEDRMNTPTGRRLAAARHHYMEAFLERFYAEWDGEDLPAAPEARPSG